MGEAFVPAGTQPAPAHWKPARFTQRKAMGKIQPVGEGLWQVPPSVASIDHAYNKAGDIVHVRSFGSSLVVLNTFQAASNLLEKRSSIYSSRRHSTMLLELYVLSAVCVLAR